MGGTADSPTRTKPEGPAGPVGVLLAVDQEVAHLGKIPVMLLEVSETATWTAPDGGERLWFLGTLATIKEPGEASHGRFALLEFLFPRYASPPLHTHPQDESYIVLEGL